MTAKVVPQTIYTISPSDDEFFYASIEDIVDGSDGDIKFTTVNKYKFESTGKIILNPVFKVKTKTKGKQK